MGFFSLFKTQRKKKIELCTGFLHHHFEFLLEQMNKALKYEFNSIELATYSRQEIEFVALWMISSYIDASDNFSNELMNNLVKKYIYDTNMDFYKGQEAIRERQYEYYSIRDEISDSRPRYKLYMRMIANIINNPSINVTRAGAIGAFTLLHRKTNEIVNIALKQLKTK